MFMCFGFVILVSYHGQDKRLVSLVNLNPIIKLIYYFSCLCLAGLPFLRAFFSKDFIVEKFIELRGDIIYVLLLLMFLGIRIYYRIKLISLYRYTNRVIIIEKSYLGIVRVLIITGVIIFIINIYIRLIFRLRLEIISFKIMIYLFVRVFLVLSLT